MTEQEKHTIENCPREPAIFECGLVECSWLDGKPDLQECTPKKKPEKSTMWKEGVWKEGMWK